MQLMVIILKNYDRLDPLLTRFADYGVYGATILNSSGMASELAANHDEDEFLFLGAFRTILNKEREQSKTIIMVVKDEQVDDLRDITNEVVGDLSLPNTGILFTTPITSIYGGSFSRQ